jgi:hypothetical protein
MTSYYANNGTYELDLPETAKAGDVILHYHSQDVYGVYTLDWIDTPSKQCTISQVDAHVTEVYPLEY